MKFAWKRRMIESSDCSISNNRYRQGVRIYLLPIECPNVYVDDRSSTDNVEIRRKSNSTFARTGFHSARTPFTPPRSRPRPGGALPLRELPWCSPGFDTHTPCRLTKHINKTRVPRERARALLFVEARASARPRVSGTE